MERSLDYKGRWRNHTVAFRVSDEEAKLLNDLVALSGLTKQEYIIRRLTCRDVVVQGNPRVYKALKNQMAAIHEELKRLETVSPDNDELLYTLQVIAKEVAELEAKKESLEEHNVAILETSEKWLGELENLEQEIHSAQKIREEADKKAEVAKKEAARYEKKLVEIAPMVKDMERFAVKYSYDPEEVLPEAGTLESGKTYREKKAKPLIEKIITVLRSVYRAYLDISRNYNDLQRSCERAWNKVNALSQYVEKLRDENIEMKEKLKDVQYLYRVMGKEKVNKIIQQGKEAETIEKMKRQAQRRTQWER